MCSPRRFSAAGLAARTAVVFALLAATSCGEGKYPKTYAVKGKVLVDGQPAKDCQVSLHRLSGPQLSAPATPSGVTDDNGDFELTSYVANDGAPEGEYVVKIEWRERSGITKSDFEGIDRLGGDYASTDKNKATKGLIVQVAKQAVTLQPFELTLSPQAKRKLDEAKKKRPTFGGPLGGDQ
jgi:hypothetical protein